MRNLELTIVRRGTFKGGSVEQPIVSIGGSLFVLESELVPYIGIGDLDLRRIYYKRANYIIVDQEIMHIDEIKNGRLPSKVLNLLQ